MAEREKSKMRRPKNVGEGVAKGVVSVFKGVGEGVAGNTNFLSFKLKYQ